MTKILAIETATKNCSVALFENDSLIDFKEEGGAYSHAEKLAVFVDELLKKNKLDPQALDAIAVSKGPGSYTGLRIGVSLAKGLCFSLEKPLIAIDTLKHMAWGAIEEIQDQAGYYCPMIDARRMEVYSAIYSSDLKELKPISADVIEDQSYSNLLAQQKVYFFGDGSAKCKDTITHDNATFISLEAPSAKHMGSLAYQAFQRDEFENLAYFEPFYLKDFVAIKPKKLV